MARTNLITEDTAPDVAVPPVRAGSPFGGQVIVATRARGAYTYGSVIADGVSDGSQISEMSRCTVYATCDAVDLRLVFGNYYWNTYAPNDILVKGGLDFTGNVLDWAFFGGRREVRIEGGATASGLVVSDPMSLKKIVKGGNLLLRTHVAVVTPGEKWPLGFRADANYESPGTDRTATLASIPVAAGEACYGPIAVIGTPVGAFPRSVAVLGDSIGNGANDSGQPQDILGWTERGANREFPMLNLCKGGETAGNLATADYFARRTLFRLLPGCTDMLCTLGRNDVSGGVALATLQGYLQALWAEGSSRGMPVYQSTITPRTQSSDSWATTGNQSAHALSHDEIRVPLNDWIRSRPLDANGVQIAGVFDAADAVETARNSGIWKAGYTNDGLHPINTGHAAIATAVGAQMQTTFATA